MTTATSILDLIEEPQDAKPQRKTPKPKAASISVGSPSIHPDLGSNKILIVGECPTRDDVNHQQCFSGSYSRFFKGLLAHANISLRNCTLTYAIRRPAPAGDPTRYVNVKGKNVKLATGVTDHYDSLYSLIEEQKPKLILAFGNVALHALTGETGITKWRGSRLSYTCTDGTEIRLMPLISPATAMRNYSDSYLIKHDLEKAVDDDSWTVPDYRFITRPDYRTVMDTLAGLQQRVNLAETRIAVDLETLVGHIDCCGLAWSDLDAICIPFMKEGRPEGYWTPTEEKHIIFALRRLLLHPNCLIETQNGSYDVQYWFRWWLCNALPDFDTMVAHHVAWAGMKKSLDFISSLYCRYHRYWKEERQKDSEDVRWIYNCKDCVATFEVATELRDLIPKLDLQEQLDFQMKRNLKTTVNMMIRGVRRDDAAQEELRWELHNAAQERLQLVEYFIGRELNPKSPKQVQELFYDELGQQKNVKRKTGQPTTDDDALTKIGKRTPLLRPVCDAILDYRSIGVLASTFVGMQPDYDGRLRCSYNIAGTETYRYSSSQNAFGSGGNLQNIPNPEKDKGELRFKAPNVKRMFTPDPGYTMADFDLDRADLQVVVWEAGEERLKRLLRLGVDLHLANAQVLFNLPYTEEDLLDPALLKKIKGKYKAHRTFAKAFVHGTNYGGSARTMAIAAHCSTYEAEAAQDKWFSTYPGIKVWHERIERQLQETRSVTNRFGFRRYYFDRIEGLLPEALAWVPQSTVAIVIDKGICNVDDNLRHLRCEPLLQVHDSGVFQFPTDNAAYCLDEIRKQMEIVIPYDDPLTIPVGAKISEKSWGDCADWDFEKKMLAA